MLGNDFWQPVMTTPESVVYENSVYVVVVTPTAWRDIGAASGRTLQEYAIVNKQYGVVEASSNVIYSAIMLAKQLTESYQDMMKEDKPNATIVGFPSKDRT